MKKSVIFLALALIGITGAQLWVTKDRTEQKDVMEKIEGKEESPIGGAFTLTDQNGDIRHDSDFRGRVMLVSFGFTHCPDICPVTVSTLSKTMNVLEGDGDKVVPIFISVDPQRDTPAVMKDFLANFNKHLIGLTGSEAAIKQAADLYKVYYAKSVEGDATDTQNAESSHEAKPAPGDYSIDHSGYIYLMGKEGQFLQVFPYNVPEQELARAAQNALR